MKHLKIQCKKILETFNRNEYCGLNFQCFFFNSLLKIREMYPNNV